MDVLVYQTLIFLFGAFFIHRYVEEVEENKSLRSAHTLLQCDHAHMKEEMDFLTEQNKELLDIIEDNKKEIKLGECEISFLTQEIAEMEEELMDQLMDDMLDDFGIDPSDLPVNF